MSEKEGKSKKGFMSRLSFRKKKSSSSKHRSKPSYKIDEDNMLVDPDLKVRTSSNVSSSQNSLEGLNGRARSTSDLIAGYEKRLSLLKDEKEKAPPTRDGSEPYSSSSQGSDRQLNVTAGSVIANPGAKEDAIEKDDKQNVMQSMTKGGFMPYRSIFSEEEKLKGNKASHGTLSDVKTDDTTQTDFSQGSEREDDTARLVKVQSTRTPETRRAHIPQGGFSTNPKDKTYQSYQIIGKETFIGPDSPTPVRQMGNSKPQFQNTSTPMPKSIETSAAPTSSPIMPSYNNSITTPVAGQNDVWQLHGEKEISISHLQSKGDHKGIDSKTENMSTDFSSQGQGDAVNTKQKSQHESKSLISGLVTQQKNSTFVQSSGSENHTFITKKQNGQSGTSSRSGNHTVIIEKGKKTTAKTVADRTFSLESSGANSVCSDDLMCDSRFAGVDESVTFEESQYTRSMPVRGRERIKSENQGRKDFEEDSVSSSLPLSSSMMSAAGRVKPSVADKDSCVMVDAVTYNNMVKELAAMRLMLLKLSTLLHEEKVVKKRSSEVQCEPMWEKSDQDTQTDPSWKGKSDVSIASIQCNIHPERKSRASQYEKQKELPKPSRLAAPSTKLAKPRTSQPAGKEDGSTETGPPSKVKEAVAPLSESSTPAKQDTEDDGQDCSDVSKETVQGGEELMEEKGDNHKTVDENIWLEEEKMKYVDLEVKMEDSSSEALMEIIKDCEKNVVQTTLNQTVVLSSSEVEGSKQIENKEKVSPKESGQSPGHSNPGSPQKTSRLQQYKAKPLTGIGSKIAKPSGSLRPPQRSKLESKTQSTVESEQYMYTKSKSQHTETSVSPSESPKRKQQLPMKKRSPNQNINEAQISSIPINEGLQTEAVVQTKQMKYPTSKVQKYQKTASQSKLIPPSKYSQGIQKKTSSEKSLESIVSDSSEGKEDENNGNASTKGSDENILNGNQRTISGPKTSSPSKVPKVRSGSRLPRGGGIPRMTTR